MATWEALSGWLSKPVNASKKKIISEVFAVALREERFLSGSLGQYSSPNDR